MTRVGDLEDGLKGSLINDLKGGLWDGLISVLWGDLIGNLMKPDSAVCVLLVKADFNACKWFKRWVEK